MRIISNVSSMNAKTRRSSYSSNSRYYRWFHVLSPDPLEYFSNASAKTRARRTYPLILFAHKWYSQVSYRYDSFVFCFHFDIRKHHENAIIIRGTSRVCKYANSEEWRNSGQKTQNVKFPCEKSYGRTALALWPYVQRVSARTAWGGENVRPKGVCTYVQGIFER